MLVSKMRIRVNAERAELTSLRPQPIRGSVAGDEPGGPPCEPGAPCARPLPTWRHHSLAPGRMLGLSCASEAGVDPAVQGVANR